MTNSKGNFLSIGDFLKLAVEFEEDSAAFYRSMLTKNLTEPVKALADLLEKQEEAHAKLLREYEIEESKAFLQFPPDFKLSMPDQYEEGLTVAELIILAIDREVYAQDLYNNAAASVSGNFKEFIRGLALFETEHAERLRSLRDYY
ncbi:MAG: hypothetical protein KAH21_08730 [Spirochaetaceae bacterium]|nr:hypothetical protein [Spirochaetaceae bacterium]